MADAWEGKLTPTQRARRQMMSSARGSVGGAVGQSRPVRPLERVRRSVELDPQDIVEDFSYVFNNYQSNPTYFNSILQYFSEFTQFITVNQDNRVITNLTEQIIQNITQYLDTYDNSITNHLTEEILQEIIQYLETHDNSITNHFGDVLGDIISNELRKYFNKEGDNVWGDIISQIIKGIVYVQPNEPATNAVGALWYDTDAPGV